MLDRTSPPAGQDHAGQDHAGQAGHADPIARARDLTFVVAARVRLARRVAGITQADMAERLGLTFQQVQKYEKGSNRISAGRLALVAEITGQPIAWFFEAADA